MGEEVTCQSLLLKTSKVSESFSFQKLKVTKLLTKLHPTILAHVGLTMTSLFLIFAIVRLLRFSVD